MLLHAVSISEEQFAVVYDCKERTAASTTAIFEVGNDEVFKQLLKLNFRPLQIPPCGETT
jgi:hypothetical protein